MTEGKSAAPVLISYAPATFVEPLPLSRTVLRWCRLAAGLLAVVVAFPFVIPSSLQAPPGFVWNMQAILGIGVTLFGVLALALCAMLYARSPWVPHHLRAILLMFWIAFSYVAILITWHFYVMYGFSTPFDQVVRAVEQIGGKLFLLLPPLLIPLRDEACWWKRLGLVAAFCALCYSLQGVIPFILTLSDETNPLALSTTWTERLQHRLREPFPLIGAWPLAGVPAAALLGFAAMKPHRRKLSSAGVVLTAVIAIGFNWQWMQAIRFGFSQSPVETLVFSVPQLLINFLITPLPIWFLGYALWHDRGRVSIAHPIGEAEAGQ